MLGYLLDPAFTAASYGPFDCCCSRAAPNPALLLPNHFFIFYSHYFVPAPNTHVHICFANSYPYFAMVGHNDSPIFEDWFDPKYADGAAANTTVSSKKKKKKNAPYIYFFSFSVTLHFTNNAYAQKDYSPITRSWRLLCIAVMVCNSN